MKMKDWILIILVVAILFIALKDRFEFPNVNGETDQGPGFAGKLAGFLESAVFSGFRMLLALLSAWLALLLINKLTPEYDIWSAVKDDKQGICTLVGLIACGVIIASAIHFL